MRLSRAHFEIALKGRTEEQIEDIKNSMMKRDEFRFSELNAFNSVYNEYYGRKKVGLDKFIKAKIVEIPQCSAITASGSRCKKKSTGRMDLDGEYFCKTHLIEI